jgi:hypothetical protein
MSTASRRNFVKGLGFSGLFLAGVAGYKEVKERIVYKQDELPTAELEKQLEAKPVLQLQATYGEELPRQQSSYGSYGNYFFVGVRPNYKPGTEKNVRVDVVPGPDGKLYVKENDKWRRI